MSNCPAAGAATVWWGVLVVGAILAGLRKYKAYRRPVVYMYLEFETSEFGRGEDGGGDEFFAARMVVVMICHCADL